MQQEFRYEICSDILGMYQVSDRFFPNVFHSLPFNNVFVFSFYFKTLKCHIKSHLKGRKYEVKRNANNIYIYLRDEYIKMKHKSHTLIRNELLNAITYWNKLANDGHMKSSIEFDWMFLLLSLLLQLLLNYCSPQLLVRTHGKYNWIFDHCFSSELSRLHMYESF